MSRLQNRVPGPLSLSSAAPFASPQVGAAFLRPRSDRYDLVGSWLSADRPRLDCRCFRPWLHRLHRPQSSPPAELQWLSPLRSCPVGHGSPSPHCSRRRRHCRLRARNLLPPHTHAACVLALLLPAHSLPPRLPNQPTRHLSPVRSRGFTHLPRGRRRHASGYCPSGAFVCVRPLCPPPPLSVHTSQRKCAVVQDSD